ncbi:helix-turn-helix transcriptional regulator [Thioalkalivibrio sulfidiphilus]|uniref:helix-turn-helix transcriptional regulator n=1 Tax=Thioalkalivibrio sulfidiphilus TaxID=1033854 RepID=UPI003B2ECC3E
MPNLPLTTEQAAELLGLKRTTLEAWRCRGGGPQFIKLGRAVRYRQADLEEWIESRTRTSTSSEAA